VAATAGGSEARASFGTAAERIAELESLLAAMTAGRDVIRVAAEQAAAAAKRNAVELEAQLAAALRDGKDAKEAKEAFVREAEAKAKELAAARESERVEVTRKLTDAVAQARDTARELATTRAACVEAEGQAAAAKAAVAALEAAAAKAALELKKVSAARDAATSKADAAEESCGELQQLLVRRPAPGA
jgi:chromosome segregation protein